MDDNRTHFVERQEAPQTPEEARQRRAATMISVGVVALVVGILGTGRFGAVALLLGVLGVALLVGGLVLRR